MINGIHLTLMIGPGLPIPAPREVVDALVSVEAHTSTKGPSGFELTFALSKNSPLNTVLMLAGGSGIAPPLRVILMVTMNGLPEVIADGIITQNEAKPGSGGQPGTLTVRGTDLTALMDLIPFDGMIYPATPPDSRVRLILLKYAVLGIVPLVLPTIFPDIELPIDRYDRHKGTDLDYVQCLAKKAGYVFYIEPGPAPGANIAYWGPEVKVGPPQAALTMDSDFETNVESMSFTYNTDKMVTTFVNVQEPISKVTIPVPIPDVGILNPPLGLIPGIGRKFEQLHDTAKVGTAKAILMGLGRQGETADCVTGKGTVNVLRYGRLLKARRLVGVRGAGVAFDGLYYVSEVTHTIKRGEYKQSFSLSRNGLVSTIPKVPV